MNSHLIFNKSKFWEEYTSDIGTLWIKGYCNYSKSDLTHNFHFLNKKEIVEFIKSISGHFAIVYSNSERTLIIVDRIASTPINYSIINNQIFISADLNKLKKELKGKSRLDYKSKLQINMGGFTHGENTLYHGINTPLAGHYVLIEGCNEYKNQYFDYLGEIDYESTEKQLIQELSNITLRIFQDTLKRIGNNQIIIPLSAGNDSRLVASCLKHLGAKNVLCYSYGNKNNFEAQTAKKIADKLGYKWVFVPLSHKSERKFYKSRHFNEFLSFSESNYSISYFQGLSSIYYLKQSGQIQDDAVFINGNSGDFISGVHINLLFESIQNSKKGEDLLRILIKRYIEKHFSLWGYLKTPKNIKLIESDLKNSISKMKTQLNPLNTHLLYEKMELLDRQSKYVIGGQKTYEFFGYNWLLPLWDDIYLNFWKKVPSSYKYKQQLYKKMLLKNNWGDVWNKDDFPINSITVRPFYFIPIRFFLKIFFVFSRKSKWKDFELIYLKYWTDPILYFKFKSYYEIIKLKKFKPKNAISWVSLDFIKSKKEKC